ncbi:hypothetical protein QTP88_009552 [Uroleucon formosanum]
MPKPSQHKIHDLDILKKLKSEFVVNNENYMSFLVRMKIMGNIAFHKDYHEYMYRTRSDYTTNRSVVMDIHTDIDGVIHATFKSACFALGLLENDEQWKNALADATVSESPSKLRKLFAIIIDFCRPSEPQSLREQFKNDFCEDILHTELTRLNDSKRNESSRKSIFLDAPGGTGKTFLINLLLAQIRSSGKVALAVASSVQLLKIGNGTLENENGYISVNHRIGRVINNVEKLISAVNPDIFNLSNKSYQWNSKNSHDSI